MKRYHLYTDGSGTTRGNPGGWAYMIVHDDEHTFCRGGTGKDFDTTNNRMELMAAIMGLRDVQKLTMSESEPVEIILKSDSTYVLGTAQKEYRANANLDLVKALQTIARELGSRLKFEHVRGHRGNKFNDIVDKVANKLRQEAILEKAQTESQ